MRIVANFGFNLSASREKFGKEKKKKKIKKNAKTNEK
jgi:hypothetical protein